MEHLIKNDDLGIPHGISIFGNPHVYIYIYIYTVFYLHLDSEPPNIKSIKDQDANRSSTKPGFFLRGI